MVKLFRNLVIYLDYTLFTFVVCNMEIIMVFMGFIGVFNKVSGSFDFGASFENLGTELSIIFFATIYIVFLK